MPIELLELYLTTIRVKTLESNMTLIPSTQLKASISNSDTITFFEQKRTEGAQSFLKSVQIISSINELSLQTKVKNSAQNATFYDDIKKDKELLNSTIQILVVHCDDLKSEDQKDLIIQSLIRANIVVVDDTL